MAHRGTAAGTRDPGRAAHRGRTVEEVEQRLQHLRRLDDHVGGTDTYAMVTGELAVTTALLRDGAYTEEVGRRLLVAIGELAQVAGWVTSDAGRHAEAKRLYLAGMRAAHAGGDVAAGANNWLRLTFGGVVTHSDVRP